MLCYLPRRHQILTSRASSRFHLLVLTHGHLRRNPKPYTTANQSNPDHEIIFHGAVKPFHRFSCLTRVYEECWYICNRMRLQGKSAIFSLMPSFKNLQQLISHPQLLQLSNEPCIREELNTDKQHPNQRPLLHLVDHVT